MRKQRRTFNTMRSSKTRDEAIRRAQELVERRNNQKETRGVWAMIKQDFADVTRQYFAPITAVVKTFSHSIEPTSRHRPDRRQRVH
jgi:hypothetical protein